MFTTSRLWGLSLVLLLGVLGGARLSWGDPAPVTAPPADPDLHTLKASAYQYYVSLPSGWTAGKSWPILVDVDGSGHHFASSFHLFVKSRKNLPFIIVTPCISSNGNDPAEEEALYEMVHEVQDQWHGAPQFFMTGFSAGGHLTYKIILVHPELLAAAALASTTYLGRGVTEVSTAPERVHLPIHSFLGDKDPHFDLYSAHWKMFLAVAQEHDFQNIEHTVVSGAVHSPFADQVMTFFASLLPK